VTTHTPDGDRLSWDHAGIDFLSADEVQHVRRPASLPFPAAAPAAFRSAPRGNGLTVPPCPRHPASAFLVDDAHVTPAALAAIRAYMDAAHAEYQAERETRADG
jgi:hypothetical protein